MEFSGEPSQIPLDAPDRHGEQLVKMQQKLERLPYRAPRDPPRMQ
jgi:hypothetical protein